MKVRVKRELLFRKAFIPWYDTEPVMLATLVFALLVLLFSLYGIAAALDAPDYGPYLWVPLLLGSLALVLVVSTLVRLIRRTAPGGPD